jgi:hypothetical protein
MLVLGGILVAIGCILAWAAQIWIGVIAIKANNVAYGIFAILIGLVAWIYAFTHWQQAKKPFFYSLIGMIVILIGYGLLIAGAVSQGSNMRVQ